MTDLCPEQAIGGCNWGPKPKGRLVRCPTCNKRLRTVFRDSEDMFRDRSTPAESRTDWHEYIPRHAPKVKKPKKFGKSRDHKGLRRR